MQDADIDWQLPNNIPPGDVIGGGVIRVDIKNPRLSTRDFLL